MLGQLVTLFVSLEMVIAALSMRLLSCVSSEGELEIVDP